MNIHIHIDDRLVSFCRRLFRRRFIAGAILIAALTTASAESLTTFTRGTPISSSAVNENFAALAERISSLENDVPGYAIVHELEFVEHGRTMGFYLGCGPGKRVVGGGYDLTAEGRGILRVNLTMPHSTGQGWVINVTNESTAGSDAHFIVFAVCVSSNATP